MLFDRDVLLELEAAADKPEKTRSSFWEHELQDFSFSAEGEMIGLTSVGNLSQKNNPLHKIAHWLLQWPYRFLLRNSQNFNECNTLTKIVAQRQERAVTIDMLRQTLSLAVIRDLIGVREFGGSNLVIGDGYGVMTSLLKLSYPEIKLITINLTTPLLIDLVYTRKAVPGLTIVLPKNPTEMKEALKLDNIDVIALQADDARLISEAPIGLAVNLHSMQEMNNDVIKSYFDILRNNKCEKTAFYCCNRIYKKLYDGEVVKFSDFPWNPNEPILLDEICRWDNFDCQPKPPFWIRNPNQKQHRLVIMENSQTVRS